LDRGISGVDFVGFSAYVSRSLQDYDSNRLAQSFISCLIEANFENLRPTDHRLNFHTRVLTAHKRTQNHLTDVCLQPLYLPFSLAVNLNPSGVNDI
jgi:hypothetical protein